MRVLEFLQAGAPEPRHERCCCHSADAVTCFDLRYYGHSPARQNFNPDSNEREQCECGCHFAEPDDGETP